MKLNFLIIVLFGVIICSEAQTTIQMEQVNGVLSVPCKVNEKEMEFAFDSRLSGESIISLNEATAMLDSGFLLKREFKSVFKDDSTKEAIPVNAEVNISIIEFGGFFIYNTLATVVDSTKVPIILGKTAFEKTGKVKVNQQTNEFVYAENKFENTYGVKYLCASGNCLNGYGSYLYEGGAIYIGNFKDGDLFGQGIYTFEDGEKYIGNFKDGDFEGEGAKIKPDGSKYVGEFKFSEFNGFGRMYTSNGQKYIGEFIDGSKNGYGIFIFTNGQKYFGNFVDDRYNGKGTMIFPNGAKYTGDFKDNKREGNGIYTLPNGLKYVGEFKAGSYNGKGTLVLPDSTIKTGNFINGEFLGE